MIKSALLAVATHDRTRRLVMGVPVSRAVAQRFVAGERTADAIGVAAKLGAEGLLSTIDHLGEDTTDLDGAERATSEYLDLLGQIDRAGLAGQAEVSIKLSAIGLALPDGETIAALNAARIAAKAASVGTTRTIDMEDHTRTDATLRLVRELHATWPDVGVVLQAYLHRTQRDLPDLAGSRVRLCKGAYREPASVAYVTPAQILASYERHLATLMAGPGYPMVATHDPSLLDLAGRLAVQHGRGPDTYEFQMLYGVRPDEQRRLSAQNRVRVYVPYGTAWYGYLMRRMAEKPANLALFLRALTSRR